jgi:phage-related protein
MSTKEDKMSMCAVRFAGTVYVLHVFQKKSKSGRATPQRDVKPE